ncbi:hypothetical protein DICVIV_09584 [Dictyocaulus viviparus]|uniref:Uncharacterized protein n=1 Tax=Dictyocaulus viviparus TaxID=29172 RepID=A0A0D8XPU5_DICVI|nr:hypothetical protein DICVIV_09584 [Dictyocaulus viviparus]
MSGVGNLHGMHILNDNRDLAGLPTPGITMLRNPTCDLVGKKSYSSRARQDQTRTSEESTASYYKNAGSTLHTLPVRLQSSKSMEN